MGRRSLLDRLIAACVVLSQIAIPLPAHAGPMDLEGQFSVSESGAATYNIPLVLPPGTGGMEPKLALAYSSQGGNGLLGVGWSLAGLSAITRCPRTLAQDGARGAVNFDSNDRFCLDGQRLMLASGTYGANGAEYRTERDAFSKIVSYGTAGNGPAWFKVWSKSGQILEYGNTADALIEAQGKTSARAWALNKATDTKGNYFTVTYTEDTANGDFYPAQIDYTGNAGASLAPNAAVKFIYEARPDTSTGYYLGSLLKNTQRLKTIQATLGGTTLREYRLTYQTGTTGRSRIASISECDPVGNLCKPATTATWSDLTASFPAGAGWGSLTPSYFADVTGDGRADLITVGSDGLYVAPSNGTSAGASTRWVNAFGSGQGYASASTNPIMLLDVDADGLTDAVGFASDGVYVARSNGSGFLAPVKWIADFGTAAGYATMEANPRTFADVNGDGRPDLIGFKADGVYVSLNTGSGFAAATRWLAAFGTATSPAYATSEANPRMVADVNGDGWPDIVGFSANGVYVALGTGTGFAAPLLWNSEFTAATGWTAQDTYPRTLADINGDGLPDLVGFKNDGVYVALNDGTTFQTATRWLADFGTATATAYSTQKGFPRYLADVNGDGRADIVGFAANGVQVALSSGTGFSAATQWVAGFGSAAGYTTSSNRQLTDLDGDGFPDIVGVTAGGTSVSLSSRSVPPDFLTTLTTGFNAATTVTYKSLTDASVYVKGAGAAYPVVDLAGAMFAVSSVNVPNGLGSGYTTANYQYGSLRADLSGRGPLGFGWIQARSVETGLATRSYFSQSWPYVGMPWRVEQLLPGQGNGGLLRLTTNTFGCIDPASGAACTITAGNRYFPYVSASSESAWDTNGAALPVTQTTTTFDRFGNATQVSVSSGDGFSKTTTSTYDNNESSWVLGRLSRSTVTSADGGAAITAPSAAFSFSTTIASDTVNYNLRNAAVTAGWDQVVPLAATVTVNAGVTVGSASTSLPAFDTGASYPAGSQLTLVNNGKILGAGGSGGSGAAANGTASGAPPQPGTAGGPALKVQSALQVNNVGSIAGGGGGGAGGAGVGGWGCGGGGGGGAGIPAGSGAAGGVCGGLGPSPSGSAGTAELGGAGGAGGVLMGRSGGAGGKGGNPGMAGASSGNAGGAAGAAVTGNANVTWVATGTRLGAIQ